MNPASPPAPLLCTFPSKLISRKQKDDSRHRLIFFAIKDSLVAIAPLSSYACGEDFIRVNLEL